MLAPVFLALGTFPEGTRWTFLTCDVDPARSLPELGPPCSTWARSGWYCDLPHLMADLDLWL